VTESIFIFTISFDFATYNSSTISPKQSITIDVDSDAATSLNIQIISIDGKFWTAEELDVMPGKNHYEIDTSDIPEGMYVISASNNEIKKSHKFIMHK